MPTTNNDISDKKVAIVLPIFNTEQYLSDCLESILSQTHKNFIVFAIDDGSTDTSSDILESYALKDHRIHPIRTKNSGVSSARNIALDAIEKHRTFDYISFIDSDDKFLPDFLETHLSGLVQNNADISICGFAKLYDDNTTQHRDFLPLSCLTQEQFALLIFSLKDFDRTSSSGGMIWKQIYKASILKDIRFSTEHNICEDELFCLKAASRAKKFIYIPKILYLYRQRPNDTALTRSPEFNIQILKGRNLCVNFATTISMTMKTICISAYLQYLVSALKKKEIPVDMLKFRAIAQAANKKGFLKNKYYYQFLFISRYPSFTRIFRHFRTLYYKYCR